MSEFVIPPYSITQPDKPVVFLAGPVQGSYDWQLCAASRLSAAPVDITIVSPRGEPYIYKKPSVWL
ncbi:hypothetical protein EOL96_03660, partial [Candidatus Saccharibacteria bacterium]|nr:hypothetical protein [Candidatus Saccharibacteria bacterium]